MKKKFPMFVVALTALPALAHVELGTYQGVTPSGEPCSFVSKGTSFAGGRAHPLNERVEIVYGTQTFLLQHPPVVNAKEGVVFFNHDALQAVEPLAGGAQAFIIDMQHTPDAEGPTAFHLITHRWKAKQHAILDCTQLQLQEP